MWAFRVRLERMTSKRYHELDLSDNPFDHIHNCQVLHYTRRDPATQVLSPHIEWMRSVCPTDLSLSSNNWQNIVRRQFTNEELLAEADEIPRLIS